MPARRTLLALALLSPLCSVVSAQSFPARPITIVVGSTAGSATDGLARAVAAEVGKETGQSVIIENRAGAFGSIAAQYVARSQPDGYTVFMTTNTTQSANPHLLKKLSYDPLKDFAPVALLAKGPLLLVVNPKLGVNSIAELVALAKRQPGKLNFASAGMGSSNHLLGEIFLATTGAPVVHVPYKGAVMAKDAVIRGEAQLMDEVSSPLIGALRAGQLVPLFMTGDRRDPAFPDIPTAAEAGLPEMNIQGFFGLLAPAGTPPEIVTRLNEAMRAALASAPVAKAFGNLGFTTAYSTPEQMATRIAEGRATYARIVRERQIHVD